MKKILLLIIFLVSLLYSSIVYAGQGCCSWHGGQAYCDTYTGRRVCNDGTYSPTCTCSGGSNYNYSSPTYTSCPANSYKVGSSCRCNTGYYASGAVCVKKKTCSDLYGYGAYETLDGKCSCSSGYKWGKNSLGQDKCITYLEYCHDNYGYGSKWNYLKNKCVCKTGYVVNTTSSACRLETEKDKALPYLLVKLFNNDDNAYVMDAKQNIYEIELGTGCSSIWKYEEKIVFIYKGGSYLDGISDRLYLDDGKDCKIWDGKEVDWNDNSNVQTTSSSSYSTNSYSSTSSNTTSCGKNSSSNSDSKCACNTGYTWVDKNDNNNLDCVKKTIYNTCSTTKNIYLGSDYKCYCKSGYIWSDTKKECIAKEKTPTELCQDYYNMKGMYSNGEKSENGGYKCFCTENSPDCSYDKICHKHFGIYSEASSKEKCDCKTGYEWNKDNSACISSVQKSVELKAKKIFNNLEKKYSNLSEKNKLTKYRSLKVALNKYKGTSKNNNLNSIIDEVIVLLNEETNKNIECDEVSELLGLCQ